MLINWFFPEIKEREKEETKRLLSDLETFTKRYCSKERTIKLMKQKKSFIVTENISALNIKTGSIPLLSVKSSNIKAVGFRGGLLYVAFNTNDVYSYEGVPQQIAVNFLRAKSKGRYFNFFIRKPGFSYKKEGTFRLKKFIKKSEKTT